MSKAVVLMNDVEDIQERFRVKLKVFEVEISKKYPGGIKAKFALFDMIDRTQKLILLVDNHEPFGFHVHGELPKNSRLLLNTINYREALKEFWCLTWEIINAKN